MSIKKSLTSSTGYRNALGQFSKAPKLAVAAARVRSIPLALTAGLLALPLTAVAGLAGGAMGLAGGVLHAGSTIAGIASHAAGGVLSATGGLAGGGKSGNVKKEQKQMQMVQSALNKKGPTGKNGGGTSLADVQSTLADYDMPEGAMSMLPTGDEDGMGMLSGMLHQIAVNTSYLGGIDSKIDSLVGLSSISVIDQAQDKKGEGEDEKGDGVVKRTFNSLSDRLSGLSSSLGGVGRTLLKGLGLAGAIILFKKFEPQITGLLASIFEGLSGFASSLEGDIDAGDGLVGFFDNMMENTIMPVLVSMATSAMEGIWRAIKIGLNTILPEFLQFDNVGTVGTQARTLEDRSTLSNFSELVVSKGGMENMGTIKSFGSVLTPLFTGGIEGTESEKNLIGDAVTARLQFMYDNFAASDGRIRWTNIGSGFDSLLTTKDGVRSLLGKYSVKQIFEAQPIVDGKIRTESALGDPKLLQLPNFSSPTGESEYIKNLIENTRYRQKLELGITKTGQFPFRTNIVDEIEKNNLQNRLILDDSDASLGNGNNGDTAMLDMSSNSQHMHETTVASLTPVYHSDLNMSTFMGNNQVA